MAYGLKKIKRGTGRIDVIWRNNTIKVIDRERSKLGRTKSSVISLCEEDAIALIGLLNEALKEHDEELK